MIQDNEFLMGKSVTIADCVAMATLQFTTGSYEVPMPPDCYRLSKWYARFSVRPSAAGCAFPQHSIALPAIF